VGGTEQKGRRAVRLYFKCNMSHGVILHEGEIWGAFISLSHFSGLHCGWVDSKSVEEWVRGGEMK